MTFFSGILTWIAEKILAYLLGRAENALKEKFQEIQRDAERGVTNEENTKKYEAAESEKERLDAAMDLLNRVKR